MSVYGKLTVVNTSQNLDQMPVHENIADPITCLTSDA